MELISALEIERNCIAIAPNEANLRIINYQFTQWKQTILEKESNRKKKSKKATDNEKPLSTGNDDFDAPTQPFNDPICDMCGQLSSPTNPIFHCSGKGCKKVGHPKCSEVNPAHPDKDMADYSDFICSNECWNTISDRGTK